MAFYWMLELLPLPVTSLIPVALFPPLGIMATDAVTKCYMEDTCMLYIGGKMTEYDGHAGLQSFQVLSSNTNVKTRNEQ